VQHHKYSLTEIEDMIPWEREIYLALLQDLIQQENERIQNMKRQQNRRR